MNYLWFWFITFLVCLVLELATTSLITIWFCGGALVALIANILGLNFTAQLIIFVAVSIILLILTRPFAKKVFRKKVLKTNVSAIIGKTAIVTKQIDNTLSEGEITVNGQIWTARSVDNKIINLNSKIVIEDIQGTKAIVKEIEEDYSTI